MNLDSLRAEWAAGARPELVFFWGHTPRKDGKMGPACFSQWFSSPFTVDGDLYPTAEHWMMAGKARLFGDEAAFADVLATPSPADVKRIGRRVKGFVAETWDAAKRELVTQGNHHKFGQHPDMARFLVSTGDAVIVEASPYDRVWGIGLKKDDARAADPGTWRGQNLLGFALMDVRDALRRT